MKSIVIIVLICFVCLIDLASTQNTLPKNKLKTLARPASDSVAPLTAYVHIKRPPRTPDRECLATIVSENIVATSAFCVRNAIPEDIFVYPNQYNRTSLALSNNKYKTIQIIRNKEYNRRTKANDIALLRLNKRITIDTKADIVNLPSPISWHRSDRNGVGTKVLAVGYDLYGEGVMSKSLKETNLVVANCRSGATTHICAATNNNDNIHGMSTQICGLAGTPILFNGDELGIAWELRGILSFDSPADCPSVSNNSQTGFTEVAQYVNWIKDAISCNTKK